MTSWMPESPSNADTLSSSEVLTNLRIKNFKRLEDVEIELGKTVVFIVAECLGKMALQALALEGGFTVGGKALCKDTWRNDWLDYHSRGDLIAVPVPDANLLWKDLHVRAIQKGNGKQETLNIRIDILVSGVTDGNQWECGFEFDYANQESFYCRPLRINDEPGPSRMPVPEVVAPVRIAFLPPMSGMAATEDRLQEGAVNVRIGEGRTAEVLRNLCFQIHSNSGHQTSWNALVTDRKFVWSDIEAARISSRTPPRSRSRVNPLTRLPSR